MLVNPYRFKETTDSTSFIIKVSSGPNGKFRIKTVPSLTYNYNLTTSDGQSITGWTGDYEITFPDTNTDYIIEITGVFPNMEGSTILTQVNYNILDVLQWGNQPWASMRMMFASCQQLSTFSATDIPDLSNVTNMDYMFQGSTFNGDISNWDVSGVTSMRHMFSNSSFNSDISNWNIGNVTDMYMMFFISSFNSDISDWDVSNVTNMSHMFSDSSFNQNINNWNVSGVTNMYRMFRNSSFNQNIGGWNVSNVTNMNEMFRNATSFNQDLSSWCVQNIPSNPTNFDTGATSWTLPKPVWGTCPDTTAFIIKVNSGSNGKFLIGASTHLHTYDYNLTTSDGQSITGWTGDYEITFPDTNTDYIIEITGVFPHIYNKSPVNNNYNILDVLQWGNQPWARMQNMFNNCKQISTFSATDIPDLSNVTDMSHMFRSSTFNGYINNWDVSSVTNMYNMFYQATSFNQNISNWDVSNVTDMQGMFYTTTSFNQDISGWDVSNVTIMHLMFYRATSFNQDLSSWCVQNITSKPFNFDDETTSWSLRRPVWGTCPP